MLIEFNVTNFRSFKEAHTFSLVKSKLKEHEKLDHNCFEANQEESLNFLHSAAIYGPNAGGKSNFLKALKTIKQMVLKSAKQQMGETLPITPFLFNEATAIAPSEFEVMFISEGVRYQYGFTANKTQIFEEWLFAYPKGRAQRWFSRVWVEEDQDYSWQFGNYLAGAKQLWKQSTRKNSLFLSMAVMLNSQQLEPVYRWFADTLQIINLNDEPDYAGSAAWCDNGASKDIVSFLKATDFGIDDIKIKTEKFDEKTLPDDMSPSLKNKLTQKLKDQELISEIQMIHQISSDHKVALSVEDESDGTQKMFRFAAPWLSALQQGIVLFVDELHDNLHPKLVQFLVGLFHNPTMNASHAQLVFTTHETAILNQDVFRRDQIWFCERNAEQASNLFPLTDFNSRNRDNLELAYLSGRYGALPFVNLNVVEKNNKMD